MFDAVHDDFIVMHAVQHEESRPHVHVVSSDGEAKFWMEPEVALARNHGLSEQDVNKALKLVSERRQEIMDAWHRHFPG